MQTVHTEQLSVLDQYCLEYCLEVLSSPLTCTSTTSFVCMMQLMCVDATLHDTETVFLFFFFKDFI